LVEFPFGDGMEVVFGGGRRKFLHKNQTDPEYPDKKGERLDGKDLIQMWLDNHNNSQYVWNKTQFDQIDEDKVDHVIGMSRTSIFAYVTLRDLLLAIECYRVVYPGTFQGSLLAIHFVP